MSEQILNNLNSSVLDIGCGFADLFDYLREHGWEGKYKGVDLVPGFIDKIRERNRYIDVQCVNDVNDLDGLGNFDYVIAVSTMNFKLNDNEKYIKMFVDKMFKICNKACIFDFMTTKVDFQHELAWHTNPIWIFEFAHSLTKKLQYHSHYMPYEFCLVLYKDCQMSSRNVYQDFEDFL